MLEEENVKSGTPVRLMELGMLYWDIFLEENGGAQKSKPFKDLFHES